MIGLAKRVVEGTPIYDPIRNWVVKVSQHRQLVDWRRDGMPVPPPHIVKQQIIRSFAERYELEVLVETGTFYGDMIEAMRDCFDKIYSIELSERLHKKAKKRFKWARNVELICGDSAIELEQVIKRLDRPALFWLDGHYSAGITARGDKDTPVLEELTHIFDGPDRGDVVIIDDARCFGARRDYPSLDELAAFVRSKRPNVDIEIQDDGIRITPRRPRSSGAIEDSVHL